VTTASRSNTTQHNTTQHSAADVRLSTHPPFLALTVPVCHCVVLV
jgi:hypothetical protein